MSKQNNWKEEREAFEKGKRIQYKWNTSDGWITLLEKPSWTAASAGIEYRVHPDDIDPPTPSTLWHNPDNLTPEQIPDGWRLFVKEELDGRHKEKCRLWKDTEWSEGSASGTVDGFTYIVRSSVPVPGQTEPIPWIPKVGEEFEYKHPYMTGWNRDIREHDNEGLTEKEFLDAISEGALYRPITKPSWSLPSPPPNQQWHRTDGWTEEMLPEGWRPLLEEERHIKGDAFLRSNGSWGISGIDYPGPYYAKQYTSHWRTRRPLPPTTPTPSDDCWIPWEGGECPVADGTLVDVKLRKGRVIERQRSLIDGYASKDFWRCDNSNTDIIAYRLCEPDKKEEKTEQPKPIPPSPDKVTELSNYLTPTNQNTPMKTEPSHIIDNPPAAGTKWSVRKSGDLSNEAFQIQVISADSLGVHANRKNSHVIFTSEEWNRATKVQIFTKRELRRMDKEDKACSSELSNIRGRLDRLGKKSISQRIRSVAWKSFKWTAGKLAWSAATLILWPFAKPALVAAGGYVAWKVGELMTAYTGN